MDTIILLVYCATVIIICVVFSIFLCSCGEAKQNNPPNVKEGANPEAGTPPTGDSPSFAPTTESSDLNAAGKRASVRMSGGASIMGIPKLPPLKGEEADVPLPKAAKGKNFRSKGPRPKKVPKAGMTAPVRPVDEDPTMPVEDDMLAYKMAAKNRPAVPIPPLLPAPGLGSSMGKK